MTLIGGLRRSVGLVLGIGLLLGASAVVPVSPVAAAGLPTWTGGVNLYRDGVFTTQRSWLWCTAADVQITRNIVDHKTDHTTANQRRYFNWMRERNRYDLPLSAGVDPAGWTAGLRHFVDQRYRLVSSGSFNGAIRSAVKRLRLTGLPVALAVSHGNHGWVLTGFRATADPAATSSFRITSVRVTGPLYGLQSKNGYDMPPNTKLTTAELRRFFTPWRYAPKRMIWDGRYVSIQPIPAAAGAAAATVDDAAAPIATVPERLPLGLPAIQADDVAVADASEPVRPSASAFGDGRHVAIAAPVDAASPAPAAGGEPGVASLTGYSAPGVTGVVAVFLVVSVVAATTVVGRRRAGNRADSTYSSGTATVACSMQWSPGYPQSTDELMASTPGPSRARSIRSKAMPDPSKRSGRHVQPGPDPTSTWTSRNPRVNCV